MTQQLSYLQIIVRQQLVINVKFTTSQNSKDIRVRLHRADVL